MSLPASLQTVTIVGTYVDLLGNPVAGSVSFAPQTIIKDTDEDIIIMPTTVVKTLDATGSLTTVLPCSNDTDVIPQPFIYTLTENFTGGRTFALFLPLSVAGTTQNLADLLPAIPASGSGYVTTDQYVALSVRYVTANGVKTIVIDAEDYEGNAEAYASATALVASQLDEYNAKQFLVMGL